MITNEISLVAPSVYEAIGDKCGNATAAIGRILDGKLLWGCVFESYTGESIEMHFACAAPRFLSRSVASTIFRYPFGQLGVGKIIAPVISGNIRIIRLVEALGFELEATIEGAYPQGKDCIYYTMTKDQCRWL